MNAELGLLFANYLVQESTRFEIVTPRIGENFSEFWKSCVYYDLLLDLYDWGDLTEATDLMGFFETNTSQARSFTYKAANGDRQITNCRAAISGDMGADLNVEINSATNIYGTRLVADAANTTEAVARFSTSLPIAYDYLTGISANAADIMSQNILANSLRRGLINFANEADASAAAQDFAIARAVEERKLTFQVVGELAKRMLPLLKNLFEAVIYAVFPLVMLLAMLPTGAKAVLGYAKLLFWINMWAPLYAILHFAMTYYGQDAASAAVRDGAFVTGLSMLTNTGLGKVVGDYSAIAGYLSASIPLIAWMVISQSGAVVAGLAGRVSQGVETPASRAADEASTGNISLGNLRYETETAFQANASPSDIRGGTTLGDGVGSATKTTGSGQVLIDIPSSNTPVNIDFGQQVQTVAREGVSQAVQSQEAAQAQLATSNAAIRSELNANSEQVRQSESTQNVSGTSETSGQSTGTATNTRESDKVLEQNGISRELANSVSNYIKGSGGAFVEVGTKLEVNGKEVSKEDFQKTLEVLSSDEYSQALRNDVNATRSNQASVGNEATDSQESRLTAALDTQTQALETVRVAALQVEQTQKQLESVETIGAQINARGIDGFKEFLNDKGLSNNEVGNLIKDYNQNDYDARQALGNYALDYARESLGNASGYQRVNYDEESDRINGGAGSNIIQLSDFAGDRVANAGNSNQSEVEDEQALSRAGVAFGAENIRGGVNAQFRDDAENIRPPETTRQQEEVEKEIREGTVAEKVVNKIFR